MTTPRGSRQGSTALYQQLVDHILAGIESGDLAVGTALPPEPTLAIQYSVSRHTVREALRILGDLGVVQRKPKLGTTICSARPSPAYLQVIRSPDELLQYPPSRLTVLESRNVIADASLAATLLCRRGAPWIHVTAVRRLKGQRTPIGWLDLFLLPEFERSVPNIGRRDEPVYQMLARLHGQETDAVTVDLGVSQLNETAAAALQAAPVAPSLRIIRRYSGPDRRVFQISVTEHLPHQFQYRLQLNKGFDPQHRWAMQA